MCTPTITVASLIAMLKDLPPGKTALSPVYVHVAAKDGWAMVPLKSQVGRATNDAFILLAVDLPCALEDYAPESDPQLTVVK